MMISVNTLHAQNRAVTMSSRELAKLMGVAHTEVKRMVKSLETAQRLSSPVTGNQYEYDGEMREEFC